MSTYTFPGPNGTPITLEREGTIVTMTWNVLYQVPDLWDSPQLPAEFRPIDSWIWLDENSQNQVLIDPVGLSLLAYRLGQFKIMWEVVEPDPAFSLKAINDLISIVPVHTGYAPSGAKVPYAVHRPLVVDAESVAVDGSSLVWDYQTTIYCCAASVEASFNLARSIMGTLQGARVGNTTLSTSMGYSGAPVEGHYESQVTVQLNQGGI